MKLATYKLVATPWLRTTDLRPCIRCNYMEQKNDQFDGLEVADIDNT